MGGNRDALEVCRREAAARGATHTVRLPSHTPLLTQAGQVFRTALREAEPRGPTSGLRLLSGIDGDWVENFEAGSEKLAKQIATPLNWAACLESCWAAGARRALEPGPGTALNRMAARVFPNGSTRSTDEFRTLAGLRGWLARAND